MFTACASKPDRRYVYAPTANAADEIRILKGEMKRTESEQIAFFAPDSFEQAAKHADKAQAMQEKGKSNGEVLEELGVARSYYEQARRVADRSLQALPDVAESRERALIAGAARYHRADLMKTDKDLMKVTKGFEKKTPEVSQKERGQLQSAYSNLELASIKSSRLGDAFANIDGAKKMGAAKYAPRTLMSAQSSLRNAEMTINSDRHNDALVSAAQEDAEKESRKLLKVTEISRKSGQAGNELLALDIYNRDEQINQLSNQVSSTQSQLTEAQRSAREAQESAFSAQQRWQAQQDIEAKLADIQQQFSPQEAEVFRQGDNLILRLRSLNFASGRSEVPASAYPVLNKVKNVIQQVSAPKVMVEGHADATGSAEVNQEISQSRADAVARYLETERAPAGLTGGSSVEAESESEIEAAPVIEAQGYGFDHPLANNKTAKGRAQNRRVDIVITTGFNQ